MAAGGGGGGGLSGEKNKIFPRLPKIPSGQPGCPDSQVHRINRQNG